MLLLLLLLLLEVKLFLGLVHSIVLCNDLVYPGCLLGFGYVHELVVLPEVLGPERKDLRGVRLCSSTLALYSSLCLCFEGEQVLLKPHGRLVDGCHTARAHLADCTAVGLAHLHAVQEHKFWVGGSRGRSGWRRKLDAALGGLCSL